MNNGRDDAAESSASDPEPAVNDSAGSQRGEKSQTKSADDRFPQATPTDTQRGEVPEEILAYTTDRRSLSGRVQIQWAIRTALGAIILGLLVTFVAVYFNIDPLYGMLATGLFLGVGMVWVVLRYRVWVYQIRADAIYLERGVLRHVRTLVPYIRIQHVDTSRGPLERALGLSTLVVYTAGSRGADISIPGLTPEEARDLQQRVKELAIEAEGGDAL